MRKRHWGLIACATLVLASVVALSPMGRAEPPPDFAQPRRAAEWPADSSSARDFRAIALRRAKVWHPSDVVAADFASNPPDPAGTLSDSIVRCRFLPKAAHGTTPKFDCVLPDGEVVKVKYGHTGEIHAEIAASRLLSALGFGADRMFVVPRVRCYGCPRFPFYVVWALDLVHARAFVARHFEDDRYTDFEWAAVERRFKGADIEADDVKGWAWWELDQVDPSVGASRAEIDALRVMAMFLAHWDNKASNQRLVCLAPAAPRPAPCPQPFAIIQDLGATFGPNKVDLDEWRETPIWTDQSRCTMSMRTLPYHGGTFADVQITEAGRQLIARQLSALTDRQIVSLFSAARFREFFGGAGPDGDVDVWARAFRDKVRQITAAGPCPS